MHKTLSLLALLSLSACPNTTDLYDFDGDGELDATDCGPADPSIYPGAPDEVDEAGIDSNCDGADGIDSDGDGFPANLPSGDERLDCNDGNNNVFPGALDTYEDEGETDENCDGIDGLDEDGDGYGGDWPPDHPLFDCNDSDPAIHPNATEDPNNPADEDCNGIGSDFDGDGFQTPEDCNDDPKGGGAAIHPGVAELCDGLDNDCDGTIDRDPVTGDLLFDQDEDGWDPCPGEIDCDDGANWIYPGAPEVCDGADNDCDGTIDEGLTFTPGSFDCAWTVASSDCRGILESGESQGTGVYRVTGSSESELQRIHCDMDRDGGGWTLALIAADDEVDTWTYADAAYLTDVFPVGIGDLGPWVDDLAVAQDFKDELYHSFLFEDILFVHHTEGNTTIGMLETWAAYSGVGDRTETFSEFMQGEPNPACLAPPDNPEPHTEIATAYPMTAGTLFTTGFPLCDTNLYFHLGGHANVTRDLCDAQEPAWGEMRTYGPAWSAVLGPYTTYTNCGSAPAWASLGLSQDYFYYNAQTTSPPDESVMELPALGFGEALGLNLAETGTGGNHLRLYLR